MTNNEMQSDTSNNQGNNSTINKTNTQKQPSGVTYQAIGSVTTKGLSAKIKRG